MKQLQIWNHKSSGETYAAVVDGNGIVVEACGALHHTEVDDLLKEGSIINNEPELVDWLNEKQDDFQLV